MAVTKKILDEIREELKKTGKEDRELTSKEIVLALAPDIHKQMRAGVKLMKLYEIVKAKLPEEARLTESTFKKYWRNARNQLNLAPIKASGRKGPREPAADDPRKTVEAVLRNTSSIQSSGNDVDPNDFWPDDPDDPFVNSSSGSMKEVRNESHTTPEEVSDQRM